MTSTLRRAATRLCVAAILVAASVPAAGVVHADTDSLRFDDHAGPAEPSEQIRSIATNAARSRTVRVDAVRLNETLAASPAEIELFDDLLVPVDTATATAGVDGGVTWSGTGAGAAISVTINGDDVRATGISAGRPFSITPAGDGSHLVAEHTTLPSGELEHVEPGPDVDTPTVTNDDIAAAMTERGPVADRPPRTVAADGMRTVSILTVYTTDARTWYGGDSAAQAAIAAMVNDTNTVLTNSNVTMRVESAGIQHVDYVGTASILDDHDALTFGETAALFDVLVEREIVEADVIMMVRSPTETSTCGIAWVLSDEQAAIDDDLAVGVIDTECAPAPDYGYVHELGHLLGAQHGMGDSNNPGAYSYSNGYRAPLGAPGGRYRTVMAYADSNSCQCPVVPYFSAPRTIAGIGPIGSASQDNARTLNGTAHRVASYRPIPMWTFAPERLLETRSGLNNVTIDGRFRGQGARAAGSTLQLQVGGRGSTPPGAAAVLMNVTAIAPDRAGHISVWPCNEQRPKASNLNYQPGQVVANTVLAKLDPQGRVCIYTHGRMDLIADVSAWVPVGASLSPVVPARLLETRSGENNRTHDGAFQGIGKRAAGSVVQLDVAGRGGVSDDATAVMLNVTAVAPDASGHVTVWPCDQSRPKASSLNAGPGQVVANAVFSKLDRNGFVCVYTHARTDLIVDVAGAVDAGSPLVAMQPARVVETRSGTNNTTVDGFVSGIGPLRARNSLEYGLIYWDGSRWVGRGGIDPDAWTVIANVTAITPDQAGHISAYPCGGSVPTSSNINYAPGQVVANMVVTSIRWIESFDAYGGCLYSHGTTHLLVDVVAWM